MEDTRKVNINDLSARAEQIAEAVGAKIAASTIDDGLVKRIDGRLMLVDCLGVVEDLTPSGKFLLPSKATMFVKEVNYDTFFWAELEASLRDIDQRLMYIYDRADEGTVTVYAGRELTPEEWETIAHRADLNTESKEIR